MNRPRPRAPWLALLAVPVLAAAVYAGGWATITVEDLPDHFVVGQATPLEFTIRQHGLERLTGLRPVIVARAGREDVEFAASATSEKGRYSATVSLPQAGQWDLTIRSGFGRSKVELLPMQALRSGERAAQLAPPDHGRRLFVAKGCAACHAHTAVDGSGDYDVGPELTGRMYRQDDLRQYLANPARNPLRNTAKMPNLELKPTEITAIIAFLDREARLVGNR